MSVKNQKDGKNTVELFINLFEKLRGLNYAQNLDRKYEYLFNIIEMGSFIVAMNIKKGEMPAFLQTIIDYRNGCGCMSRFK